MSDATPIDRQLLIAFFALVGLIFGSFASVAAHRIPKRETIVSGRSRCPQCGRTITAAENIPVLSYLIQRGRCRGCGAHISVRYPLMEIATGTLFALAAWKFGASVELIVFAAFFWVLVVLSVIDFSYRVLPNRVVYPAFALGWAGLAVAAVVRGDAGRLIEAAAGALLFGGFFFVVALFFPAGMGGGDVKLAFVLGTFLGYLGGIGVVLVGMFLSFFLGGLIGVVIMVLRKGGRKTMVPFGPFLALGTIIAVFVGRALLDAYLGTL